MSIDAGSNPALSLGMPRMRGSVAASFRGDDRLSPREATGDRPAASTIDRQRIVSLREEGDDRAQRS